MDKSPAGRQYLAVSRMSIAFGDLNGDSMQKNWQDKGHQTFHLANFLRFSLFCQKVKSPQLYESYTDKSISFAFYLRSDFN
jgi:hypothetical protein